MEVGKKIKQLRVKNGLTLEELASRCELTKGYLSQVERDLTIPSLLTLQDIVEALGLNLAKFFQEEKPEQIVFTEEDFFVALTDEHKITWIVPNAQKNEMEPIILELLSNQSSFLISPYEGEEFGYVLAGKVVLVDGEKELIIKKGQTFYFQGKNDHYLRNDFPQTAKVLWVMTPPNF